MDNVPFLVKHVKMLIGDKMQKLNTILFDLDGTLIDTNDIIVKSYKHAFKKVLPDFKIDIKTIIENIGPPLKEIFSLYTSDEKKLDALMEAYLDFYKKHEHDYFKLYPNVKETLAKLKNMGINIAIVTSKFTASAQPSIEHFNLSQYFDAFISLDMVDHPKPHPDSVYAALKKFDNVGKAIMIGDNPSDIQAGQNAEILSAGVAWSIKGKKRLEQERPDYILKDMNDIFAIIKTESGE